MCSIKAACANARSPLNCRSLFGKKLWCEIKNLSQWGLWYGKACGPNGRKTPISKKPSIILENNHSFRNRSSVDLGTFLCSVPHCPYAQPFLCITFGDQAIDHRPRLQDASWWPTLHWPELCVGRRSTHQDGNVFGHKCSNFSCPKCSNFCLPKLFSSLPRQRPKAFAD